MPKVLHVVEYIKGGVATATRTLVAEHLKDADWDQTRVLVIDRHSQFLNGIPVERIDTYRYDSRGLRGFMNMARGIRRAVKKFQPDIVYLHSTFPGAIGRILLFASSLMSWRKRPAIVYNAEGWSFLMQRRKSVLAGYRFVEYMCSYLCDRVICISENEYNAAVEAGMSKDKLRLVNNALAEIAPEASPMVIPERVLEAKKAGLKILLFVGRYDEQKGIDLLVDAMRLLSEEPVLLICAGESVVSNELFSFPENAIDLGWATPGQVTFLLEFCDAMVVPSRWEGFGIVAIEAGRASRPVVCSNRGGLPEIVVDGVTGFVIRDLTPSGIAAALLQALSSDMPAIGEAAKRRFDERYTSSRMFAETKVIYHEAIQRAGR